MTKTNKLWDYVLPESAIRALEALVGKGNARICYTSKAEADEDRRGYWIEAKIFVPHLLVKAADDEICDEINEEAGNAD